MPENNTVSIVILAAGEGSRMKPIKQLLPWNRSTLIEHSIQQAFDSYANEVILVLGANYDVIKEKINKLEKIKIIKNPEWKSGMLSSIKSGIKCAQDSTGAFITLVDQPAFSADYLNSMIGEFKTSDNSIIATKYQNTIGVPALFPKSHFQDILALSETDGGAKTYILQHIQNVILCTPSFEVFDIDTIDQYEHYYQKFHN